MKSVETIQAMIHHLRSEVIILKRQHSGLDQISMLSGEGSKLREKINKTKGIVIGLEWILNDGGFGDYDME